MTCDSARIANTMMPVCGSFGPGTAGMTVLPRIIKFFNRKHIYF